jgi:hypothetical protein
LDVLASLGQAKHFTLYRGLCRHLPRRCLKLHTPRCAAASKRVLLIDAGMGARMGRMHVGGGARYRSHGRAYTTSRSTYLARRACTYLTHQHPRGKHAPRTHAASYIQQLVLPPIRTYMPLGLASYHTTQLATLLCLCARTLQCWHALVPLRISSYDDMVAQPGPLKVRSVRYSVPNTVEPGLSTAGTSPSWCGGR